jgi:8-oxo-dGTP pyrophosphatase MutT (NUDIX family)
VVAVREAATVVLVRDASTTGGPALEVLTMRRTPAAVFSPGATVFPGGAVDADDAGPAVAARMTASDVDVSTEMSLERGGLAIRAAAARECFEEAGLLLARTNPTGAPVDHSDAGRRDQLARLRHRLNLGEVGWRDVLDEVDAVVDVADLHLFAHWRTPVGAPRRYDTWFFVAMAPDGDDGVHDDNELVASAWASPSAVLARYEQGEVDLILPTFRTLTALARYETAAAVIHALRAVERDPSGRPAVVADRGGERVALPGDPQDGFGWTVPLPDLHPGLRAREGVA